MARGTRGTGPRQVATSTNQSKIIVLYEATQECVWLRRMIDHIHISCGIGAFGSPIIIYEDNAACVAQMQMRHIETNYTTHISPKKYSHQLQESGVISILQIQSYGNYIDPFIKLSWFVTLNLYGGVHESGNR
jgi:hypothetical protein